MLHVGIGYSFEKKMRLFIVDYIKPSPVYQVKCKLVIMISKGAECLDYLFGSWHSYSPTAQHTCKIAQSSLYLYTMYIN